MGIAAGRLRYRAQVLQQTPGTDDWGAPSTEWLPVPGVTIPVNLKSPSGISGARNAMQSGIPHTVNFYSVMMRARESVQVQAYSRLRIHYPGGHTLDVEVQGLGTPSSDTRDMVTFVVKQVTSG